MHSPVNAFFLQAKRKIDVNFPTCETSRLDRAGGRCYACADSETLDGGGNWRKQHLRSWESNADVVRAWNKLGR